ncbi:MAG TPA: Fur family transcriptional regulator [Bryobacteraceae bacterium]|nr:Fur family transcriptional regulator [Bryobacteraceae bacterium]
MRLSRPEILAAFREHKVRCTPQRFTILDYLNRNAKHPSAEEIYKAINRTDPRASLATVYKSLHAMASAGLIREVTVDGNAVRFESNMAKHHHFVCERCGNIEDLGWYAVPKPPSGSLGKRILREYELVFRGLCTKCARPHAR